MLHHGHHLGVGLQVALPVLALARGAFRLADARALERGDCAIAAEGTPLRMEGGHDVERISPGRAQNPIPVPFGGDVTRGNNNSS